MADVPAPAKPLIPPVVVPSDASASLLVQQLAVAMRGEAEAARLRDMDALARQRADEDKQRAAHRKIKLVAVTAFTLFEDDNPNGRVVQAGEEFEISLFDGHKYAGKGLPRAVDPLTGGVTISQG